MVLIVSDDRKKADAMQVHRCSHKRRRFVEVVQKNVVKYQAGAHLIGGEKTTSNYVAIYFCPDCKETLAKDVLSF